MRCDLQAPNVVSGPAPLSLTSVLDRSESMQGRKLDLLKKTNQYLVEVMKKNSGTHDLGIVTYSNLVGLSLDRLWTGAFVLH